MSSPDIRIKGDFVTEIPDFVTLSTFAVVPRDSMWTTPAECPSLVTKITPPHEQNGPSLV
ncbi:MAG TPA: hypothetical protein VFY85_09805 [Gemmatimonadaceae bacterium]|nr:hypothetical protein [Gemmatimonadaceae bacterium]